MPPARPRAIKRGLYCKPHCCASSVEYGKQLSDYWSAASVTAGKYDLRAFGPNGFLREFKGNLLLAGTGRAQPEVESIYDPATGYLRRLTGHVETGLESISDPAIGA